MPWSVSAISPPRTPFRRRRFTPIRAAAEDQIVAKLDLGKEEPVLATSLFAFLFGEKGSEGGQPFLRTVQDVARGEGIG